MRIASFSFFTFIFLLLRICRIDKTVDLPAYSTRDDAAFDLRSREDAVIEPQKKAVIKTGIKIAIPKGHVGFIWDRSGLAANHHLTTLAGVVDSSYRGEVGVVLHNLGTTPFIVEKNMRIAQMVVQPYLSCDIKEVQEAELETTQRGEGGFGSTGLK